MGRTVTGTTTPFFVAREENPNPVRIGTDYFLIQIRGAQAAFTGRFWESAKQLIVVSRVNLNHFSHGSKSVQALQRSRQVKKDRAEQLGLSPNLISLVPAVMPEISISIDFLLDKENRLAQIGGLINSDAFLAAVSLAPTAATVAKTIGGVADKMIQTFMPAEEREPILQFAGDFNLATGGVHEGYYVILGTRDEANPLPRAEPNLSVTGGRLLIDGKESSGLSYVILDVRRVEARGRAANDGAAWARLLSEAEDEAGNILANPLASDEDRRAGWKICMKLLKESQILLRTDPNYHRHEAENIVKAALFRCRELVSEEAVKIRGVGRSTMSELSFSQSREERLRDQAILDFPDEEDLEETVRRYQRQAEVSEKVLATIEVGTENGE